MSTTRDALLAGSVRFQWVVAIEGYKYLLTNGSTAAALTAWAGTDWTLALDGLSVDFKQNQSLDPNDGFTKGTPVSFSVKPDVPFAQGDRFGIDTHRKVGGAETQLTDTVYPNAGDAITGLTAHQIPVSSTSQFASSGEAHIGCECFSYTSVGSQAFAGVTRGKYSPFSSADEFSPFARYARLHRVGEDTDALSVQLQPIVTSLPRMWTGRRVGIWLHRVVGDVLDTKDEAQLVFAGRISGIVDSPSAGIVVQCDHVLNELASAVLGNDLWSGTLDPVGTELTAGMRFTWKDWLPGLGGVIVSSSATDLVVDATATGTYLDNKIAPGNYTVEQITAALSTWIANQSLNGSYSVSLSPAGDQTSIKWTLYNISFPANYAAWEFTLPEAMSFALGFRDGSIDGNGNRVLLHVGQGTDQTYTQPYQPVQQVIATDGSSAAQAAFTTVSGTLVDNYATMPIGIKPATTGQWGLFVVNDALVVLAQIVGPTLQNIQLAFNAFPTTILGLTISSTTITRAVGDPPIAIRQILAFESAWSTLFLGLASSTGAINFSTTKYNGLQDKWQTGAAIPRGLLDGVVDTMDGIPGSDRPVTMLIEKPTKLSDAFRSDFSLRWAFAHWFNGSISLGAWRSPTNEDSITNLGEDTKAEAAGSTQSQTSPMLSDAQWLRNVIKLQYSRDALQIGKSEVYGKIVSFVDRVSVDEHGAAVATLALRNTYDQFAATGAAVEALLPGFMALMPLVSREAQTIQRSIDPRYYWQLPLGAVVTLADGYARDPATGMRRITNRAAFVTTHNFWISGQGDQLSLGGEVKLFLTAEDQDRAGVPYVPSADVQWTVNTSGFSAGYNATTNTLWCNTNNYTNSGDGYDLDAFTAGDKILIIEIDPIDPDAPLQWTTTVVSAAVSQLVIADTLTGWDATKKYHVLYQDFGAATTHQKTRTYQADIADGLVININLPYLYSGGAPDLTADANPTADNVSLIPSSRSVDGSARDVAHETDLAYALDHFVDYKSTQRSGWLFPTDVVNTDATEPVTGVSTTASYKLVAFWPVFLSLEILSSDVFRSIYIAPLLWSTDGTATKVRVTLTRLPPTSSRNFDTIPSSITGSNQAYGYAEWTGITSTTPYQPTAAPVVCTIKHPFTGMAWVCLELGYKCGTRGIPTFHEGPRQ